MARRTFSAVRGRTSPLELMVRETVAVERRARAATSLMFIVAQITIIRRQKLHRFVKMFCSSCNRLHSRSLYAKTGLHQDNRHRDCRDDGGERICSDFEFVAGRGSRKARLGAEPQLAVQSHRRS